MFAVLPFATAPFASGPIVAGGGSAAPVIIDVTASTTGAVVTYSGVATFYRLNGGAPTALAASPATISGLTANTEYALDVSADGSAWVGPANFGTLNPGAGGGGYAAGTPIALAQELSSGAPLLSKAVRAFVSAAEVCASVAFASLGKKAVVPAIGTELAPPFSSGAAESLGAAVSAESAVAFTSTAVLAWTAASELDGAPAIFSGVAVPLVLAAAREQSVALSAVQRAFILAVVERAFSLPLVGEPSGGAAYALVFGGRNTSITFAGRSTALALE